MNRALSKLPNSGYNRENNFLYRSFYMSEYDIKKVFIEGKIYLEKGFLSTSYDYDNFLKYWFRENPTHNVIMKVQGKNGKLVDDVSEVFEESEVVFRSGSEYDVARIKKIPNPLDTSEEIIEIILKEK